jgi:bifunctional non-homologous end joining protein LigD
VYSLRARERPTVSTPLTWEEVEEVAGGSDPDSLVLEAADLLERVQERGDLFAAVLESEQRLPTL